MRIITLSDEYRRKADFLGCSHDEMLKKLQRREDEAEEALSAEDKQVAELLGLSLADMADARGAEKREAEATLTLSAEDAHVATLLGLSPEDMLEAREADTAERESYELAGEQNVSLDAARRAVASRGGAKQVSLSAVDAQVAEMLGLSREDMADARRQFGARR